MIRQKTKIMYMKIGVVLLFILAVSYCSAL